jgi:hypothetical protein
LEECYEKREEKKNENAKQLEDIVPANENWKQKGKTYAKAEKEERALEEWLSIPYNIQDLGRGYVGGMDFGPKYGKLLLYI